MTVTVAEAHKKYVCMIVFIMQSTRFHRVEQILKVSQHLCEVHSLKMYAAESRRKTDIVRLSVWGERQDVLRIPFRMLEYLPDEDIEIVQSGRRGQSYLLLLVVTERLISQKVQMPERRAKLRGRLQNALTGF